MTARSRPAFFFTRNKRSFVLVSPYRPPFLEFLFPFWIKRQFYYIQDSYLRESDEAPVTFFHVR
jgi:hypothetical protein